MWSWTCISEIFNGNFLPEVCILGIFLPFSFLTIKREKILISCKKSVKWKIPTWCWKLTPWTFLLHFMRQCFWKFEILGKIYFDIKYIGPRWLEVENISPDHFYCIFMWQFSPKWHNLPMGKLCHFGENLFGF